MKLILAKKNQSWRGLWSFSVLSSFRKLFKDADNWLSSLRIHQIIFIIALSLAVTILWLYGFFTTLNSDYSGMSRVDVKEYVGTYYEYKDGKPAKALTLSNQNGKEAEMTVTDLTNGSTEHWSTDKFGHVNALTDYYIGSFSDENDTKGAFFDLGEKDGQDFINLHWTNATQHFVK